MAGLSGREKKVITSYEIHSPFINHIEIIIYSTSNAPRTAIRQSFPHKDHVSMK